MLKLTASLALAATLSLPAASTLVAQQSGNIAPASAASQTAGAPNWTNDQILTATVHQAWLLSGKNEATFFEIVSQLAEISAKDRGLQLPESAAAGRAVGLQIKTAAKADTGQLLYAVVDAAIRKMGKPLPNAGQ